MATLIPIKEDLIAPCGMNCAICSNYLACINNFKMSQCAGCRTTNKKCSYLFEKCTGINHTLNGNANARFCFECDQYPCKEINRMDRRYRESYGISTKENLEYIKRKGLREFVAQQYNQHKCLKCGELVSIHNKKCFKCDAIIKLVEKSDAKK